MIILAHPVWLLLIPFLFLAIWLALRNGVKGEYLGNTPLVLLHPDLSPLPEEKNTPHSLLRFHLGLNGSALLLLVLALAQPQRIGDLIPEKPEGREIIMLIDTSKTMSIDDFVANGQRVERLTVLKEVVSRFVEARQGDRFGVIVFGTSAVTMVPSSFDRNLVTSMIQRVQVGIAGDNTALGDAIGLALKQLRERQTLRPALILFSDNTDNTAGEISPSEAVILARRMGAAIYTVQIGSDLFAEGRSQAAGMLAVEPDMQQIAELTGGRAYRATNSGTLHTVVEDIGKLEQTITRPSARHTVEEWYGVVLLLAVSLFSASRLLWIRRMAT